MKGKDLCIPTWLSNSWLLWRPRDISGITTTFSNSVSLVWCLALNFICVWPWVCKIKLLFVTWPWINPSGGIYINICDRSRVKVVETMSSTNQIKWSIISLFMIQRTWTSFIKIKDLEAWAHCLFHLLQTSRTTKVSVNFSN